MKNNNISVTLLLLTVTFCVSLILANILESKIANIQGVTITAGLLLFPVTYIINDCIVEVWGYKKARLVIWLGFLMNFFAVGIIQLSIILPPDPTWSNQIAFETTFSATARIVAASLVAFLIGSFVNAYIMSKMKAASNGKNFSLRAIISTLFGEAFDSAIFFPLAFIGILDGGVIIHLIIAQTAIKTLYEILILPVTIRLVRYLKKIEKSDIIDKKLSYNILKIKDL